MAKDKAGRKRFDQDYVSMTFYVSATSLLERGERLWKEVLCLLCSEPYFTPEKYDEDREPPQKVFGRARVSEVLEVLARMGAWPYFERYEPYCISFTLNSGDVSPASPTNCQSVTAEKAFFNEPSSVYEFIRFCTRFYGILRPLYGYGAQTHDSNNQNKVYTYFPEGHPRAGEVYSITGFGGDIRKGIPGIYWANFFSRIYVDTIGREKFLTAPCYSRRELPDGGFLLLTSASPLEWDKPEVQELRRRMRDHLGYEYFCDIENPKRKCKVPKFDFSVWEKECEHGMKIPERLQV